MLYTLAQTRQIIAQNLGIQNTLNVYDFDDTTNPTLIQANIFVNDAIRENTSNWDYTFLESSRAYPFFHVISGVQSITGVASGTYIGVPFTGSGASVTPYPSQVLNYTWNADNSVDDINNTFSGIPCTVNLGGGIQTSAVMVSGAVSYLNWTGVGFAYQLDSDVDKIMGVLLQQSISGGTGNGLSLGFANFHDINRMTPIGMVASSGTPYLYTEMPGLNPTNGKSIQLWPSPTINFSGESFVLHYKKKHVDLVNDSDTQIVVPEQFQYLIPVAVMEKIAMIKQDERYPLFKTQKESLISDLRLFDATQPNKMFVWSDFNYRNGSMGGRSAFDTSSNIYIP